MKGEDAVEYVSGDSGSEADVDDDSDDSDNGAD